VYFLGCLIPFCSLVRAAGEDAGLSGAEDPVPATGDPATGALCSAPDPRVGGWVPWSGAGSGAGAPWPVPGPCVGVWTPWSGAGAGTALRSRPPSRCDAGAGPAGPLAGCRPGGVEASDWASSFGKHALSPRCTVGEEDALPGSALAGEEGTLPGSALAGDSAPDLVPVSRLLLGDGARKLAGGV
jgi:hypothetical protein